MYRSFTVTFCILIIMQLHAQSVYFNITKPDNTETFYTRIQSEIKIKTVGIFSDTLFSAGNTIYQVTRYRNFEAPGETNNIWTIVDKYEYRTNGRLEKTEHWKTDNDHHICKCGDWQYKTKGIWSFRRPYPRCNKKGFHCNSLGEPVK